MNAEKSADVVVCQIHKNKNLGLQGFDPSFSLLWGSEVSFKQAELPTLLERGYFGRAGSSCANAAYFAQIASVPAWAANAHARGWHRLGMVSLSGIYATGMLDDAQAWDGRSGIMQLSLVTGIILALATPTCRVTGTWRCPHDQCYTPMSFDDCTTNSFF